MPGTVFHSEQIKLDANSLKTIQNENLPYVNIPVPNNLPTVNKYLVLCTRVYFSTPTQISTVQVFLDL
jgi:hypothetical protein